MLSSIFFINVTLNSICLYHESFHLHIQAFKYQTPHHPTRPPCSDAPIYIYMYIYIVIIINCRYIQ